jgi:hypothetical protein
MDKKLTIAEKLDTLREVTRHYLTLAFANLSMGHLFFDFVVENDGPQHAPEVREKPP